MGIDPKIAEKMKKILMREIVQHKVNVKATIYFRNFPKLKQWLLDDLKKQGRTQPETEKMYNIVLAEFAKLVATRMEKEILKKIKTM